MVGDRFSAEDAVPRAEQAEEHDEYTRLLWDPFAFHEMYQEAHTYFHALSTSRIDRVYSNHHPTEQFAFDFCAV